MIFLTGDMHGDKKRFKQVKKARLKKKDVLIICGDFGFVWTGEKKEARVLKWIGRKRYITLFVDGCNENHKLLAEYPITDLFGGKARKISGNLYCLNRGEVYEIDGKTVFAFGGGDANEEFSGKVGDPTLLPSAEEMQNASRNLSDRGDKVDIIVTHDAPSRLHAFIKMQSKTTELTHLNTFLEDISNTVKFNQWYFGKYHQNKKIPPCYSILFTDVVRYE